MFNKTIAGRRKTLLLNVKPARMSVKIFSSSLSYCSAVLCPDLGSLTNGQRSTTDIEFGTILVYTCGPLFRLVGTDVLYCQANMMWNGTKPVCQSKCKIIHCILVQHRSFLLKLKAYLLSFCITAVKGICISLFQPVRRKRKHMHF